MEGWVGVCKWKPSKYDSRKVEKVCAYASGKFPVIKSTIDAEIYACMEALTAMKIHYLDRKEITLRTDCHAIIKFFNKTVNNKPSRVRWITFIDYITGTGVDIKFEHIEGINNELADALSRLVHHVMEKHHQHKNKTILELFAKASYSSSPSISISHSSVEHSHKAALRKHFIWSNVLMDITFGIVLGILLLANVETICSWILVIVHQVTNDLLRSGSVWLMGVPAGFKLNNELAELIGIISLNAIQVFSTLWSFMGAFLQNYMQVLALLGIVFGLTVPMALCIDLLKLATLHIYILHCLMSFLYSQQIQALASLWRLFRGQKRNPLRQRFDSYDYTVEQHVVGSLLFTPLLLLIPTTSVFYIFFTSLITTIIFLTIIFEISISLLHATPYAEIWIWIMIRRRFPSGIWFEVLDCDNGIIDEVNSHTCLDGRQCDYFLGGETSSLVSLLCSNYATIGQVILPYYVGIFNEVTPSFFTSLAHGILSGQRFPSTLGTRLPSTMPWMQIACKEYWKLCYTAVLSSRL
ncbi:uncharacterized protein LOC122036038 [Zingiber officinale]|uniref:uncharacterized protein LOC122036038 n=1 Tax=Zingiber officinale TaxID=94328 RepID=UPI001C4C135C|nr:uncharacterized protein LOC122036038 [Zingiber officinale]